MADEVLQVLAPQPTEIAVDGTFGLGGHGLRLLNHVVEGRVVGIERDGWVLERAQDRIAALDASSRARLTLHHGSFADLDNILDAADLGGIDVGCLDLGVNSIQVNQSKRGFHRDDPTLDLRYDPTEMTADATTLLATASAEELADILFHLGDERLARPIARALVRRREEGRPVQSAEDLAGLVAGVYRRRGIRRQKIHPVTRTVQALRLAVNDELEHVTRGVWAFLHRLNVGGRLAVLTFHSGEARIVKRAFNAVTKRRGTERTEDMAPDFPEDHRFERLIANVLRPSDEEVAANPRSRSAQLRAVRRVA